MIRFILAALVMAWAGQWAHGEAPGGEAERVPVLYSTDLYHPHVDLDDHFDLAQLFALPELDVRGILLDVNGKVERSGRPAVEQMMALTGRTMPWAIGLARPLSAVGDKALDQPAATQAGVELILRVLRESDRPVTVITTGSLRDVIAALNREPKLVREKVGALYVNIGNAAPAASEYNVDLDAAAYRALFESRLPVAWFACFPADHLSATYWRFDWRPIFEPDVVPRGLRNYFAYAMEKVDVNRVPAKAIFDAGFMEASRGAGQHPKEMWCTPSLLLAAKRKIYRVGENQWVARRQAPAGAVEETVYRLAPARVEVDARGKLTRLEVNSPEANVQVFQRDDVRRYERVMSSCLLDLYRSLPVQQR